MSILSLRKSVSDLDQAAARRNAINGALSRCIQSAGQYAIELEDDGAAELRSNLDRLAQNAHALTLPEEFAQLAADVRGELREYRDQAQAAATQLRENVNQAIETMQGVLESVSQTDDHELTLRREFGSLEKASISGDLNAIRKAIGQARDAALRSCEAIQRSRELVIAQLQDEIRSLHRTVDEERRAALSDPATGLWSRAKLESRIKDLSQVNQSFCVFLIGIADLAEATDADARLVPGCLNAIAGRLTTQAGKNGEIGLAGRWSEEIFAIIFDLPLASVPTTPEAMEGVLCGAYAIQLDGASHRVVLSIHVRAVERRADSAESAFYVQLGQAAFSVIAH
jgi:GGDEF domain-containing protein